MGRFKNNLIILVALTILALGATGPTTSYGAEAKLAQVVYITKSKACGCTLVLCQAGDIVVGNVFNGAKNGTPEAH